MVHQLDAERIEFTLVGRARRIISPLGNDTHGTEQRDGMEIGVPVRRAAPPGNCPSPLRSGLVQHFVETSGGPIPFVVDDIPMNFYSGRPR